MALQPYSHATLYGVPRLGAITQTQSTAAQGRMPVQSPAKEEPWMPKHEAEDITKALFIRVLYGCLTVFIIVATIVFSLALMKLGWMLWQ